MSNVLVGQFHWNVARLKAGLSVATLSTRKHAVRPLPIQPHNHHSHSNENDAYPANG